jgi:hypothetical protein
MNFAQIATGQLDIWIWFALSSPILVISLLSMRYDVLEGLGHLFGTSRDALAKRTAGDVAPDSIILSAV